MLVLTAGQACYIKNMQNHVITNWWQACRRRFTLLELIATLTLAAILAAMTATYLQTGISGSATALSSERNVQHLQSVMEAIIADFQANYRSDLVGFRTKLNTESGNSASAYGLFFIVHNQFIKFDSGNQAVAIAVDEPQTILQVSIAGSAGAGATLTRLFFPN